MPLADPGPWANYLREVIEALPQSPPPYCLIGALAVNAWGRVRTTQDIDLLVLSQDAVRTAITHSLINRGFEPDASWIEHNPMAKDRILRLSHPSYPGLPLDLMFSTDSHEESVLDRRRPLHLLGVSLWVCSPEDVILLKLKASRPHDFEDALSVVKNPHLQLDLAYLRNWADRLGLHSELHYILQTAATNG